MLILISTAWLRSKPLHRPIKPNVHETFKWPHHYHVSLRSRLKAIAAYECARASSGKAPQRTFFLSFFCCVWIQLAIFLGEERWAVRAVPVFGCTCSGVGEAVVGCQRSPERFLPDMVWWVESSRAAGVVMGQTEGLHCAAHELSSWKQSNSGIKPHIFRVTWSVTADTPPAWGLLTSIVTVTKYLVKVQIYLQYNIL